ncbi:MAG TPA: thioesterase family protein [Moheibacter sp.]|nr:thioesterase family protein [Moheibacter sp.]
MKTKKDMYQEIDELSVEVTTKIRFNETDALGIVWHGNYLIYFEDAREAFGKKHGISYLNMLKNGYVTPIVSSSCQHKLTLKYGDTIRVRATYVATLAAKIMFRYTIFNEQNQIVCTGETVQVFLDQEKNLSLSIPAFYEKWKENLGIV